MFSFPEILVFTSMHNVQNTGLNNESDAISEIAFEVKEEPIYFIETKSY
ncbi:MAG: hypothetical protein ABI358_08880 [Ginsengibacter sp.]